MRKLLVICLALVGALALVLVPSAVTPFADEAAAAIPVQRGIALGQWRSRPADTGLTWSQRMAASERQFGTYEGHWRDYLATNDSGKLKARHIEALTAGKRLFSNWKVCTSWAAAARGSCDAVVIAAARDWSARCAPSQCMITFWHEPENDITTTSTAAQHKAMFQRVSRLWHQYAPDVPVVWTMMGWSGHRGVYDDLWPGGQYVDLIGHDPYIRAASDPAKMAAILIDQANWFRANLPGASTKPVIAAEWGYSIGTTNATAAHKAAAIDGVTARLPEIVSAGHVELDLFEQGGSVMGCSDLSCADAQAYKRLKTATEG